MLRRLLLALAIFACAIANVQAAVQVLPAETCFSASIGSSGVISTLGSFTAGSGGSDGTYAVALLGGTGSGATATVIVTGGVVTSQTLVNAGQGYAVGDSLTASPGSIGGVVGYSTTVASTAISGALAGGSVAFYAPSTTTPKSTWKDAAQTTLNPNPVILDGNGCALIYGLGSYRQVLQDNLGNTVWDQTFSSPQANLIYAGVASGTPNAITVTAPAFTSTDGQGITFTSLYANTTSATLNGIVIEKNTASGPVALTGGELAPNTIESVVYSTTASAFILTTPNPATTPFVNVASAATTDLGTANSSNINITGTTGVTSFGSSASVKNPIYNVTFAGSLLLTYNATSLIIPGAQSITTAAGDSLVAQYLGSGNWRVLDYTFASGPLAPQVTVYTTGSGTYSTPARALYLEVEMCGGGSGGSGGGTALTGATSAGGATTFGAGLTANGAPGAPANNTSTTPTASTATGGDINIPGGLGDPAAETNTASIHGQGINSGASSRFGNGGLGASSLVGPAAIAATAASGFCAGGGGGGVTSGDGNSGWGGNAGAYLSKIIASPATTYAYAVGSGSVGTGFIANGTTGAAGAGGLIRVTARFQ